MEQKRENRLIRPTAKYVGPPPRRVEDVPRHVDELA
jgi:citrate synthase